MITTRHTDITDWRGRGKARPSERKQAIDKLWPTGKVSLAMAEQIVYRWEFMRYLVEQGEVES